MSRVLYSGIMRLALPLVLLRLWWRGVRTPAYRRRIGERLAWRADIPGSDIWIHAVSVGEVQAAYPLIRHWLGRDPERRVLVTTTTPTGAARVRELLGDSVAHRYTPLDLPGVLRRFLDQAEPRLAIIMETEIWPNTLAALQGRGIPAVLANARLSARSARGYARFPALTRGTLRRFSLIAAQSEADAQRFLALGADPERIQVTGSIKFDCQQPADLLDQATAFRRAWGAERSVWVAASTHEGEEPLLLAAHRRLLEHDPEALLVLVPRHPERFDRVASLVLRQGFTLARRSQGREDHAGVSVFLGDTMGELPAFLAAADVAFIGGSLVPVGGHNPLEATAVGVPVLVGPHTFNFTAMTELLMTEGAARRVTDAEQLAEALRFWLTDTASRARSGARGRDVVERNRGALDRLIAAIETLADV